MLLYSSFGIYLRGKNEKNRSENRMKNTIVVLFLCFVAGCAHSTAQGLREKHHGKIIFEVQENYQPVYRKIVTHARERFQGGLITAQMIVQGDLYTDIQSGNVTVALHSGWPVGVDTYMTIDIEALSENQTGITTYYAFGTWRKHAKLVEEWVRGKSPR